MGMAGPLERASLAVLFIAAIIATSLPDTRDGLSELGSEVSLLSEREAGNGGEVEQPDHGSDKPAFDDPDAYFKIPNFVFSHLAESQPAADRMECQRICNANPKCRSYSYREASQEEVENQKNETPAEDAEEKAEGIKDAVKNPPQPSGECLWSVEGLHYALGWKFYTKAKDLDWKGQPHLTTENFHTFPGLEYQESSFKTHNGKSLATCKSMCAEDPKCGAFSFNEEASLCRLAGNGVHYDPHFSYYEKPSTGVEEANPGMSEADLESNAQMLASQEKSAKAAANQAGAVNKKKRQEEESRKQQANNYNRIHQEKEHKSNQLNRAEDSLLSSKREEAAAKDRVKVESAFESGYFMSRGMAQEKKIKEVKIKKMMLASQEQAEVRENQKKAGESEYKKRKSDNAKKVATHELKIQTSKEKLGKIKNEEMADALKDQEQGYKNLALDEEKAMLAIQKKHEVKVASLKHAVASMKDELKAQQAKIASEKALEEQIRQKNAQEIEQLQGKHDAAIAALKLSTGETIRGIAKLAGSGP
jgi:hypothetical protein